MDNQEFKQAALDYHEFPKPGKINVVPSKQLANQHDLALAYSPAKNSIRQQCNDWPNSSRCGKTRARLRQLDG